MDKKWFIVVENVDKKYTVANEFLPLAGPFATKEHADALADTVIGRFKKDHDRFWFATSGVASTVKDNVKVVYKEYTNA